MGNPHHNERVLHPINGIFYDVCVVKNIEETKLYTAWRVKEILLSKLFVVNH